VTDFLIVLDAEREVLNKRDQLAQAQTDTATALVSVYQALSGHWLGAGGWAAPAAQ
jgi:outer membrane protein, multidrug efflux system